MNALSQNLSRALVVTTLSVFCAFGLASTAHASPVLKDKSGVALSGYDVVAYHDVHEAVRGSKAHAHNHEGATYYFSSATNKAKFAKAPAKFLPKFGGFCAFAVAMKNAKVPSDPRTFKIVDGKLHLFFNDYYEGTPFNTIVPWNANEKSMISKANKNWKQLGKR